MSRLMLPMRGAALGHVASALRLTGKTVTVEPTRKRLFSDSAEVSELKLTEAVHDLVNRFFAPAYLGGRGFDPDEVAAHNGLMASAMLAALDRWSAAASLFNAATCDRRLPLAVHLTMFGVERDAMLRVAAYDVLFGRRHPICEVLVLLLRTGAVREWWRAYERCLPRAPSLAELTRRTRLHRETLKNLRRGELKTAGVLGEVAAGLGQLGARDSRDRLLDAPRIEFELRVAVALDELQRAIRRHPEILALFPRELLRTIGNALAQMDRGDVEDILCRGILSTVTAKLEPAIEVWCAAEIVALVEPERRFAERAEALLRAGRHEDARELCAMRARAMADELRQGSPNDELMSAIAGSIEWDAACFEALSADNAVIPARPPRLDAELKAATFVLNQRSPWRAAGTSEEDALREAIRVAPHLREPRRGLARCLAIHGRHDEALATARELVTMLPDDLCALEDLIEHLALAERWDELIETRAKDARSSTSLRAAHAAALVMVERLEEAEPELDAVLREDERNQVAMRARARLLRRTRRSREAAILERRADYLCSGGIERLIGVLMGK